MFQIYYDYNEAIENANTRKSKYIRSIHSPPRTLPIEHPNLDGDEKVLVLNNDTLELELKAEEDNINNKEKEMFRNSNEGPTEFAIFL